MANIRQLSFSGGEIDPALYARIDQVKYATGLRTCLNHMVMRHGGATNRPGTGFVAEIKDSSKTVRIIPFIFNASQTYVLEFGDLYMRVHRNGVLLAETAKNITGASQANPCVIDSVAHGYSNGDEIYISSVGGMTELNGRSFKIADKTDDTYELQTMDSVDLDATGYTAYTSGGTSEKAYEIVTPYVEADLPELRYIQSADIVTLTHPTYAQRELSRTGHTSWALAVITFGATIGVPASLLSSSPGSTFNYKVTAVDAESGEESLPSALEGATNETSTLTWDAVTDAGYYNVYKLLNGEYGWIGVAGAIASPTFTDVSYVPDAQDTPPVDRQPFALGTGEVISGATQADPCVLTITAHSFADGDHIYVSGVVGMTELNGNTYLVANKDTNTVELQTLAGVDVDTTGYTAYTSDGIAQDADNYPSTCTYYQQRMLYGNTNNNTEGIWTSKSALRKNFMVSTPLQDNDAVTFSMVGKQVNAVKHLLDLGQLLIFTASGEKVIEGDDAGILTPTAINPRQHTYNGSGSLPPIVINGTAIYIQARGSVVRDLGYDNDSRSYKGRELSIFSAHLFDKYTIADWAFQQIPHSIVWAVRSDGVLLGMTYLREHEVNGWHRHTFSGGLVENVCVVPEGTEDVLYLLIKRTIDSKTVRYIERMKTRQVIDIRDSVFMDSSLSYDGRNTGATTMTLSGGTDWEYDETLTLTASVVYFTAAEVGNAIWIEIQDSDGNVTDVVRCEITAYTSTTIVSVKPHKTVPVAMRDTAYTTWSRAVDEVGGLWHLEGEDLSVLADGFVSGNPNNDSYGTRTVTNGIITLDDPHVVIHAGLAYISDLETLNIDRLEGASLADKKKNVNEVTVFVESSRGLWAGPNEDNLTELKQRNDEDYDSPIALATGVVDIIFTPEWNSTGKVLLRQTDPLPLSILAVVPSGYLAL